MPVTNFSVREKYQYLEGFGSYHQLSSLCDSSTGILASSLHPLMLEQI